ncbi:hypothetical protein AN958_10445 [Leucoagaricus sp. SymC.cos]|nr:hypothetical protein AN958_10445 [Leucoagaricus sp. SymC.cos]
MSEGDVGDPQRVPRLLVGNQTDGAVKHRARKKASRRNWRSAKYAEGVTAAYMMLARFAAGGIGEMKSNSEFRERICNYEEACLEGGMSCCVFHQWAGYTDEHVPKS